ncbi:MAG: FAD:protein FMN transferase, partial [Lachnospiraceae bacterium]|nr:FAD:protein FMN transferase [Lachnospiraceae bacterium]
DYRIPEPISLKEALSNTGYERLVLKNGQVNMPEGYVLDLGAVGKGYTLDVLAQTLAGRHSVTGATISLGGSVLTYGSKPDGRPWYVGVVDPHDSKGQLGVLSLTGQWCVSTSGDYQRFVEVGGKSYHHILDPATGYPGESDVKSVTILCKSGLLSDALSTACFLLGSKEGMKLAKQYEAEALFVTQQGEVLMTEGMQTVFRTN